MTTYRVGIVGSGFGGRVHAPGFTLHPQFEPVAIASPNNAQKVATERKIPHAFPSLDAMLDTMGNGHRRDRDRLAAVRTPSRGHDGSGCGQTRVVRKTASAFASPTPRK